MKIYLAGVHKRGDMNSWQYQLTLGRCDHVVAGYWEPSKKGILGSYDYAGPFIPVEQVEDPDIPGVRFKEHDLRLAALRCSDVVFSWMPDVTAFWELGVARGARVKTIVASPSGIYDWLGPDYQVHATSPPTALIEALKQFKDSGHFFNGVWRKMISKWANTCAICGDANEIGDDIMWRKKDEEARGGDVCHVECFVLNAPYKKMDKELQALGMGLLRKRVRRLEQENDRLVETVQDLA